MAMLCFPCNTRLGWCVRPHTAWNAVRMQCNVKGSHIRQSIRPEAGKSSTKGLKYPAMPRCATLIGSFVTTAKTSPIFEHQTNFSIRNHGATMPAGNRPAPLSVFLASRNTAQTVFLFFLLFFCGFGYGCCQPMSPLRSIHSQDSHYRLYSIQVPRQSRPH